MQQKITPNLWFDGNAKQAADFYVAAFPDSTLGDVSYYPESEADGLADFQTNLAGKELTIGFNLMGMPFMGINAGSEFKFNPSVSFTVRLDTADEVNKLWASLSEGGTVLMELAKYPFNERYGWVQDRFGLSWQLMVHADGEPRPSIMPSLLFTGERTNQAEEAITYYLSVFKDTKQGTIARYPQDTGPAKAGSLMYADFNALGQWFVAMDSGVTQNEIFNEAVSFSIACKDQAEIDYYWQHLSAFPENEQCGWCKDKFGLSWQIVPANMGELMAKPNAYAHMMQMKKLVIADF